MNMSPIGFEVTLGERVFAPTTPCSILADALEEAGRMDEAIELRLEYFDSFFAEVDGTIVRLRSPVVVDDVWVRLDGVPDSTRHGVDGVPEEPEEPDEELARRARAASIRLAECQRAVNNHEDLKDNQVHILLENVIVERYEGSFSGDGNYHPRGRRFRSFLGDNDYGRLILVRDGCYVQTAVDVWEWKDQEADEE